MPHYAAHDFGTLKVQNLDLQGNAGSTTTNNDWRLRVADNRLDFMFYNGSAWSVKQSFGNTSFTGVTSPSVSTYTLNADTTINGTLNVSSTSHMSLPSGTNAQRPAAASSGMIRYNTDSSQVEYNNGTIWQSIGSGGGGGGGDASSASGDFTVTGNLVVNGDITTLSTASITFEDKDITIGSSATSDADANGGGLILKAGSGTDKTLLYNHSSTAWVSSENFETAAGKSISTDILSSRTGASDTLSINDRSGTTKIHIDAQGNIGIGTSSPTNDIHLHGNTTFAGHIVPAVDGQYDIGTASKKIRDIYVTENSIWLGDEFQMSVHGDSNDRKIGFRTRKKDENNRFKVPAELSNFVDPSTRVISGSSPLFAGLLYDDLDITQVTDLMRVVIDVASEAGRYAALSADELANKKLNPWKHRGASDESDIFDVTSENVWTHDSASNNVYVNLGGKVGIGTNDPQTSLHVNGTIRCSGVVETSDKRVKKDITTYDDDSILDRFEQIGVKRFRFSDKVYENQTNKEFQLGLLADEVEAIIPEAVFNAGEETVHLGTGTVKVQNFKTIKPSSVHAFHMSATQKLLKQHKQIKDQLQEVVIMKDEQSLLSDLVDDNAGAIGSLDTKLKEIQQQNIDFMNTLKRIEQNQNDQFDIIQEIENKCFELENSILDIQENE